MLQEKILFRKSEAEPNATLDDCIVHLFFVIDVLHFLSVASFTKIASSY